MKKHIRSAISLILLLGVMMATFATAYAVEARYVGVLQLTSSLSISYSGAAECSGKAILYDEYMANVKVELRQDGTTIKTWTNSGSGTVRAGGTYYVTSGHTYVVTTTVTVYDNNGNTVASPTKDSVSKSY